MFKKIGNFFSNVVEIFQGGVFELKKNKAGKWSFNLKSQNNKVIATSQAYSSKAKALQGIKSIKLNALKAKIKIK